LSGSWPSRMKPRSAWRCATTAKVFHTRIRRGCLKVLSSQGRRQRQPGDRPGDLQGDHPRG
jgi:hypothetical protein